MDAELLLRSGESITLSPAQLRAFGTECARRAIQIERNEFLNKKECCKALGGRRQAERLERMGILKTNTTCPNGEWRVFKSDLESALQFREQEAAEKRKRKKESAK